MVKVGLCELVPVSASWGQIIRVQIECRNYDNIFQFLSVLIVGSLSVCG